MHGATIKTDILCLIARFVESGAVYEIRWKNIVEPIRPQMAVWLILITCWMPKAANAHSE